MTCYELAKLDWRNESPFASDNVCKEVSSYEFAYAKCCSFLIERTHCLACQVTYWFFGIMRVAYRFLMMRV